MEIQQHTDGHSCHILELQEKNQYTTSSGPDQDVSITPISRSFHEIHYPEVIDNVISQKDVRHKNPKRIGIVQINC